MLDLPRRTTPADVAKRESRLRGAMSRRGDDALVLSRVDTIAWLTAGSDFGLVRSSPNACAAVVVAPDAVHLFAYVMDTGRLMAGPHGAEWVVHPLTWRSPPPVHEASRFARGIARTVWDDTRTAPHFLSREMWILDELDLSRLEHLGSALGDIVLEAALSVRPRDTGRMIAGRLAGPVHATGLVLHELMVGVDGQLESERHPLPTDDPLDSCAMIHPTVGRWGLHSMASRVVAVGTAPSQVRTAVDVASRVESRTVQAARPGRTYGEILAATRDAWSDEGRPDEWLAHFQGGRTGYVINEPMHATSPRSRLAIPSVHNWFITCAWAKKEEMWATAEHAIGRCLTLGDWPTFRPIDAGPLVADILPL